MSGSASLSAARRRRAGGSGTTEQASIPQPAAQQQQQRPPHPMQILENHEIRLRNIEANSNSNSESDRITLNDITTLLEKLDLRIAKLETSNPTEEVKDIKDQLLKLQAFAIETNTFALRMQHDNDTRNNNKNDDENESESDNDDKLVM